jgi:sorting nexin-3/12
MSTGQHKFQSFQTMTGASTRDQTIEERYGIPENFLEIEVKNPQTHGNFQHFFCVYSKTLTITSI